jgi:hypothetical protein
MYLWSETTSSDLKFSSKNSQYRRYVKVFRIEIFLKINWIWGLNWTLWRSKSWFTKSDWLMIRLFAVCSMQNEVAKKIYIGKYQTDFLTQS